MEIKFLGAASEVGRSGILLKDKKNILMDYGLKVNDKTEYPLPAGPVDAFILSHSHLDHCGNAPALYHTKQPIAYGTHPSLGLAELLIQDSLKINRLNKTRGQYSKREAGFFSKNFRAYGYHEPFEFSDYTFTFYDAGHIPGSAVTKVEKKGGKRTLVYTGDFKIEPQNLHNGAEIVKSDILVMESTYGGRDHPEKESTVKLFISSVKEVIDNGGTALIPAFAVGRSQEILALLHKHQLSGRTYMDGMCRAATEIVLKNPGYIKDGHLLEQAVSNTVQISKPQQRQDALKGGNIIITTAGMLNGGPVLDYITKINNKSMIFLTGYQAEGTNGRHLLEEKPLLIDGQKFSVRTPFAFFDFSAHAGREDLHKYVTESEPEEVVLVHGDVEAGNTFKEWLEGQGFKTYMPKVGESVKIDF